MYATPSLTDTEESRFVHCEEWHDLVNKAESEGEIEKGRIQF